MTDPLEAPAGGQVVQGIEPATRLPYGVSSHYASLARSQDPRLDPIAAQFVPTPQEQAVLPYESTDPIGDSRYLVAPRLVHHYADRALLLVSDRCATYCRFCFRRHFTGNGGGRISDAQLDEACAYLARTPAVKEILLSGGDPLMLPDSDLHRVIRRLRDVDPAYVLRVCTRMPVVLPSRVTDDLARMLGAFGSVWMVIHANHPRELTEALLAGVRRLLAAGVPVVNQSVLLRAVNDDVDTLEQLFRGLLRMGVKPYYLFQGDLASGTAHFRVPLARGMALVRELRSRLSGLAMPTYAVDLPGGGKVPVETALLRAEADAYVFRGPDGAEYRYPREE
ncbi:MAG TPA: KamA family radical SAM protein [Spirochaetia bacterium]|nr:KamA family radical SAM protein [Spirochaetia bacterium]